MKTKEIRQKYLDFFAGKDHLVLPSFSLIPTDDPTLLLIGAGMAPLKPYFTGEKKPPHPRIATCQKCVRTPDIDRVGKTSRHATFFEMLGNFSFGDYFKEEAVRWAWELVTGGYRMPENRLYASVYHEDQEAYDIWHKKIGLPENKIFRLGKEDNFWEIGPGPCGPCSEIYYDLGMEHGCGRPHCQVGCDCDRYVEIWNLVFTQFNRDTAGNYHPLENKNIDTGAGLERIAMALQGVPSFYEIDIIRPLLDHFVEITGVRYKEDPGRDVSLRILTEHLRSLTFMVVDGVLPSNEGRGYVLRRIIRRAFRYGRLLGLEKPFLYQAVPLVTRVMGDVYPQLQEREEYTVKVVQLEEERFQETLEQGLNILGSHLSQLDRAGEKTFPGEVAFKLYDTFGFPLDLTRELVEEKGLALEEEGFQEQLDIQREKGRAAREGQEESVVEGARERLKGLETRFLGYGTTRSQSRVLGIIREGSLVDRAGEGQEVSVILEATPFYAESGGQVGDRGRLFSPGTLVQVQDTVYGPFDLALHRGKVQEGEVRAGQEIEAEVDRDSRATTCKNHTATHLLHKALKEVLGDHVNQAGSLVTPERLRFDYTHFASLEPGELAGIEERVNRHIWDNHPVEARESSLEEAREQGVMALFDEKYGEKVRVVSIGDYSRELCGGTHTGATGEIGLLKIVGETGIGTGLRRLEAVSGPGAFAYLDQKAQLLKKLGQHLKTGEQGLETRLVNLLASQKEMEKEIQQLQQKLAAEKSAELLDSVISVGGMPLLAARVEAPDMEALRSMADRLRDKLGSGIVVLGAPREGKVMLVATVTKDLIKKGLHAGKIAGETARLVGGGGGGRPDLAQAGGSDPSRLDQALDRVPAIVKEAAAGRK